MINCILQGRTGNNFFQYAAGRALAIKYNTDLLLDGSWSNNKTSRQFEHLKRLPLAATYHRRLSLIKRALVKSKLIKPYSFHLGATYIESSSAYDPAFSEIPDNSQIVGFFQSPLYFEEIEIQLRKELDLSKIEISSQSKLFEDELRSKTTTSIHVRRGDYLGIKSTKCLDPEYYQRAIRWFKDRYPEIRFCIFSDDIEWCKNNFLGDEFLFSDSREGLDDPLLDLRLMASCSHHIIVNSSYSWWGAWLNSSKNKQVIAPEYWMKNYSSSNILLKEWIVLNKQYI